MVGLDNHCVSIGRDSFFMGLCGHDGAMILYFQHGDEFLQLMVVAKNLQSAFVEGWLLEFGSQ